MDALDSNRVVKRSLAAFDPIDNEEHNEEIVIVFCSTRRNVFEASRWWTAVMRLLVAADYWNMKQSREF